VPVSELGVPVSELGVPVSELGAPGLELGVPVSELGAPVSELEESRSELGMWFRPGCAAVLNVSDVLSVTGRPVTVVWMWAVQRADTVQGCCCGVTSGNSPADILWPAQHRPPQTEAMLLSAPAVMCSSVHHQRQRLCD